MAHVHVADNQKIAQLLISKKLASRDQISALWPRLTPANNIGALLVDEGLLPPSIYAKIIEFFNGSSVKTSAGAEAHPPVPVGSTQSVQEKQAGGEAAAVASVTNAKTLPELLAYGRGIGASDIHLSINNPVIVRRHGTLLRIGEDTLDAAAIEELVRSILTAEQIEVFKQTGDLEFVYMLPPASRYRMTIMRQRAGWECTARCIPEAIRSFEATGMPQSCKGLTQWAQGLVLITGPACCGKTSSLVTLVEMINQTRSDHVITLEAPVEYVFTSDKAQITQREIGRDTVNQEAALRAALREDPDIIVVGELRDLSTIQLAVSAAETGHLVFATMNTISASRTIYRLIDSFPPEEQTIMRNMISESLRGVISQQLIPRKDGSGMVAAYEVLLVNSAVANMIRKDEAHQLGTAMITGKAAGMQLLEDSLRTLAAQGVISDDEVAARSFTRTQSTIK